jgi:predicted protein tyrosine phosphatase
MLRRVIFVSQRQAEAMPGRPDRSIISITDPGQPPARLQSGWASMLRLGFHDVDSTSFPGSNPELEPMRDGDAARIGGFLGELPPVVRCVIVHCRSGISRSAGVARAIAEFRGVWFPPAYDEWNRHVYHLTLEHLVRGRRATRGP